MKRFFYSVILVILFSLLYGSSSKAASKVEITNFTITDNTAYVTASADTTLDDEQVLVLDVYNVTSPSNINHMQASYSQNKTVTFQFYNTSIGVYQVELSLGEDYNSYNGYCNRIYTISKYYDLSYINNTLTVTEISREEALCNASTSDKKKINKLLAKYFKAMKTYNISTMKKCYKTTPNNKKFVYNKDLQKFIKKAHKKRLKYEVESIDVSGNKGEICLKVDYYDASGSIYNYLRSAAKNYLKTKKMNVTASDMLKKIKKDYKKDSSASEEYIYIKIVKVNGTWKFKKMSSDLYMISDCNVISTLNYYKKYPLKLLW